MRTRGGAVELFNDATVQEHFRVLGEGNEWVSPQPITDVSCEVRTRSPPSSTPPHPPNPP